MGDIYPDAIVDNGNDSGEYTDNGEPKGLLHTTEGKSYAGARSAYVANNSWPHFTATHERGFFQIYQHNPLSRPSRSLRNLAGGVQTNRDNIIQIELVGSCDTSKKSWGPQYVENFPKTYLDGIRKWMRWVEANHGVPRRSTVTFWPYPKSSGNTSIRLSGPAFDAYSGWLGHQHAPENTHGDPGLINIDYLLSSTDWFDMATKAELDAVIKANIPAIVDAVWDRAIDLDLDPNTPTHRAWVTLRDARNLASRAAASSAEAVEILETPDTPVP